MIHALSPRVYLMALVACIVGVGPLIGQDEPPAQDSLATEGLPLEPTRRVEFWTDRGSWMSVDVSPDGSTIVFDLLGDLYTLPIRGGEATPLLTASATCGMRSGIE